jgi:hypothetical protein
MAGAVKALASERQPPSPPPFGDAALLALYERGQGQPPRVLAQHFAAAVGLPPDAPLGDLARRVWALGQGLSRAPVDVLATCPDCGAKVEFALPENFALPEATAAHAIAHHEGQAWHLRLPDLGDLGPLGFDPRALCPEAPWSQQDFRAQAEAALELADPALHITFALSCPDCAAEAAYDFDPLTFVWSAVETAARQLVAEVVQLARAFGWSETEILALSAPRRALYLAAVRA